MERLKGEGVHDWLSQHLTSPWNGHQTVASELGNDIILNIRERWSQLESSVRLGVLFSLISLKKAQQIQLKDKCQELIDHACSDPDDWVRLVSQMLQDYPNDGILRFNVEQFADQAQLGSLLDNLTSHIAKDGIKFHPKESAYLNDSVCKIGQGKDSKTKSYPPITGPSLQKHFSLRESHSTIDSDRAQRLQKMAEQASPIIPSSSGGMASLGSLASNIGGAVAASGSAPGVASGMSSQGGGQALGTSGLGPPRPKPSSSGLFVKKPASPFLRNNAPRPMAITRNPSATSLPLRSPRTDQPLATARMNQKSSRIQILDIQQGTEIMQSMNDAKKRKEEAEQREKDQKKEQRLQEMEAKRQLDAEKKNQILREKEEKKKEREEAKKAKERQKQEREEQLQQQQQDRERERLEREKEEKEQGQSLQARDTHPMDDEDEEATLSNHPVRKKARTDSSRISKGDDDDDDYDSELPERTNNPPMSPMTPSLTNIYSRHGIQDDGRPPPMDVAYAPGSEHSNYNSDSYFPPTQSHQHVAPMVDLSEGPRNHPTLFQNTNLLTQDDRAYIGAFLQGQPVPRPNGNDTIYQIVMNQEEVQDASGKIMYELILIEMNFDTGEWRKIKRKRNRPHVPAAAVGSAHHPVSLE